MAKLIIFGIGQLGQLAHYYFTMEKKYEIVAFTIDKDYITAKDYLNLPIIEFENIEKNYNPKSYKMFVAIGYKKVNKVRFEKYQQAKEKGYDLVSYISPRATIYDNVETGDNCFIFEDNTIQPFAKIGNDVTLWSGNHIGHHSSIGDHCFITSHVVISGGVIVKPFSFIGVNSTIRDHITIGSECVIGAGSLILKDTKDREVYTGQAAELSRVPSNKLRGI